MKRIKVKFEQITDIENIKSAIVNAARNKKDRRQVNECLQNLDKTAVKIQKILLSPRRKSYLSTGTIRTINEGTGRKVRMICRPKFFPDQIIHWAVMQTITPYFTKRFYPHSYASVPGKGVHRALRNMNRAFRKDVKGTKYCLQFDIRHAYDSVDKELIVACVRHKIKDPRVVDVISDIIYSYVLCGLPKGFYSSAWLFNAFLTPADNFLKQDCKVKHLYRYLDNFQIYGGNKRELKRVRDRAFLFINEKLHLEIKNDYALYLMPYKPPDRNKKERRRFTDFIGFKMYRYNTEIRKSIFKRIRRLCLRLQRGRYTAKSARRFSAYRGYVTHTNSCHMRQKYINGKINISKLKELIRNESTRNITISRQA